MPSCFYFYISELLQCEEEEVRPDASRGSCSNTINTSDPAGSSAGDRPSRAPGPLRFPDQTRPAEPPFPYCFGGFFVVALIERKLSDLRMLSEDLQVSEDISKEIVQVLCTGESNKLLEKTLEKQEKMLDLLLETEATASHIIQDFLAVEKSVAEKLIGVEAKKQSGLSKLHEIERELKEVSAENTNLEAELKFLMKELEELREMEDEMERMQKEVDEDTTTTIPSAVYLAQLYHKVTRIQWDYDCDPTLIRGIHYNGDLAQPIEMDSKQHSGSSVCDYLWSLVSTEW
ncbi:kinetochore protein spc24-like isoform X2 [Rhinatrema bivittatum]|uniref:kinetochore protein spc24-like isoform X2 n=1 Tax=Rhinatrema bivittatum TaxID=194408 RepID=UPI00112D7636|nr:kinetochore protein spc24-like isoform X2 [Rhinatrema bivittatum]